MQLMPCRTGAGIAFERAAARLGPYSIAALLLTIVRQPLMIAMLAVPILIQVFFNSGLAYWLNRELGGRTAWKSRRA